jgi:flavin-dependent dehydrogenase
MIDQLEQLLPGSTEGGVAWRGHHLPLSSWSWQQPDGAVLLAGDAAHLVNPLTGEGIYYAVATGVLAGRSAAAAISHGRPRSAGARHRRAVRRLLAAHLRSTTTAARLATAPILLDAGLAAASRSQGVFDDLVELGLGGGRITPRMLGQMARGLARSR